MKRNAACVWFVGLVVSSVCSGAAVHAQSVSHAFNAAAAHDAGAAAHLAAGSHLGSDMRAADHLHASGEASHIGNIHPSSSEYRPIETHTSIATTHASTIHPSSSEYRAIETHATVSRDVPKVQAKPEPRVTAPAAKAQPSSIAEEAPKASISQSKGARNRLSPVQDAEGPHTAFKRDTSGDISRYETYSPQTNPRDPKPFVRQKAVDLKGEPHHNKVTKQDIATPHVHDEAAPGGLRVARADELPKK